MDFDEAVQGLKKQREKIISIFLFKADVSEVFPPFFRVLKGQWRKYNVTLPSVSSLLLNWETIITTFATTNT